MLLGKAYDSGRKVVPHRAPERRPGEELSRELLRHLRRRLHAAGGHCLDGIALAKQQPGKINIGSAGNGTLNHLIGEMLGKATGIDLTHVPYKGAAAAATDLVAGQVQVSVQSLPSSIAFIRSGRMKGGLHVEPLPSSRCWPAQDSPSQR